MTIPDAAELRPRRIPKPGRLVRLWPRVRPYRRILLGATVALVLSSAASLAFPMVVAPGTSIHDELREFVAAGLTSFDALRGATTSAAEFLNRTDLGRVAVGARADLLLLEANPLSNIENAKRIDGVVLGGAWRPIQ